MRIPFLGGGSSDNNASSHSNGRPQTGHDARMQHPLNFQPAHLTRPPPPPPSTHQAASPPQPLPNASQFPQLAEMSVAELQKALLDPAAFTQLVAKIAADTRSGGSSAMEEVAGLRRSNIELAKANLAREGEIDEVRRQIAIVRSGDYETAKAAFEEKFKRQEAVREHIAPERLIEGLSRAAQEAEAQSDALERSFRAGELKVDDFVDEYVAIRTKYHTRDVKYQAALQTIPTSLPPGAAGGRH